MSAQAEDIAPPITATRGERLRQWVINHDDSWLFFVPYIGLAVILSIAISLFWLVVVVAVHFALEVLRQHFLKPGLWGVLSRSLWELKLDVSLILFALALGVYMEITLGLVGLGGAARAGAMTTSRFLVIQRVLRGILLSLDDLVQVGRVFFRRRAGEQDEEETTPVEEQPIEVTNGWTGAWSLGDKITLGFGALCLVLIVGAPFITHYTFETLAVTLLDELQPFPEPDID